MAFGLNIFKTVTFDLSTTSYEIYTAPAGYSAIILMAQVTNITGGTEQVTMAVLADDSSETSLASNFDIPANDSAGMLTGKLVLEAGYGITGSASANNALKLVLSILESKN